MESLAYNASKRVDPSQLENFQESLHGQTDIFSKKRFIYQRRNTPKFEKPYQAKQYSDLKK